MSYYHIKDSIIRGHITVPSSKSHTLRAILFGTLGSGKTVIKQYLPSLDVRAMIHACQLLGAHINIDFNHLEIEGLNGQISPAEDVIHAENSGLILRFISAIAALSSTFTVITGDHSIRHRRPIKPLLEGLTQLGVFAVSTRGDDYAPVIIRGPLKGGQVIINGADSQPVSALLIASAFIDEPTEIVVKNPGETPWVLVTLDWFDRLGIHYENHHFERYRLFGRNQYKGFNYTVPGDLSSAAFPIAAALVTQSDLVISNIDMQDSQGDKELITVLQQMGALIEINDQEKTLHIKPTKKLKGMKIDVNRFIDAVPILAVIGCFAEGETHISGATVARQKESDRVHAMFTELKKMGANVTELPDGLRIKQSSLQGANLDSHLDHRIVMALTIAAMGAKGESKIENVDCVAKSYPTFAQDFQSLGAAIEFRS
jgi:3-phosphoshikimate 1-carboxyvinyltransferase